MKKIKIFFKKVSLCSHRFGNMLPATGKANVKKIQEKLQFSPPYSIILFLAACLPILINSPAL